MTELFEEYDSDDDSYVGVDEFTTHSSINSQKQNNQISRHDHCLSTSSLPPTITPYASPSNVSIIININIINAIFSVWIEEEYNV